MTTGSTSWTCISCIFMPSYSAWIGLFITSPKLSCRQHSSLILFLEAPYQLSSSWFITLIWIFSTLPCYLDFAALNSFAEGPPFTLQRLCEILLDARNIYSKLSKLALALEKNLLVTSILTISSNPYASTTIENATEPDRETKGSPVQSNLVSNGVEPIGSAGDADEVMAEVEEAEVEDVMTIDMDTIEAIVRSSEADTMPTQ
ncbi:hypothetical protein HAX54_033165 [Datura stramonium]|uniref:Uncharacterized protein n=1 Tax=Datura stramonium TaxID=4076 RepID=A0ABS8VBW1_DATST|nr:hypothetical protein [Datura stramonium]